MSRTPFDRPPAKEAGPQLLVLDKWEDFTAWFFAHTRRWPKAARFTLTQRVENHVLDITEELILARYERAGRERRLRSVNLSFERIRHLLRLARRSDVMPKSGFETAIRHIDETGRMVHGWRQSLGSRAPRTCGNRHPPGTRPEPHRAPIHGSQNAEQ